jgi:prepilin-type N-terminal cleavage/methylation domain-containing protein
MHKRHEGFTIVELLIVIVVIAILASITIVAFNGVRTRAAASAYGAELKAAAKAFALYKTATGGGAWALDTDAQWTGSAGSNPSIANIVANNPTFRNFLQNGIQQTGLTGSATDGWFYDSDNDAYIPCTNSTAGVNLALASPQNTELAQAIDNAIDDGNLSCGKLHMGSTFLLYTLSDTP